MYENDIMAMSTTAKNKANFMDNNMLGFFLMSMMAGAFIALNTRSSVLWAVPLPQAALTPPNW